MKRLSCMIYLGFIFSIQQQNAALSLSLSKAFIKVKQHKLLSSLAIAAAGTAGTCGAAIVSIDPEITEMQGEGMMLESIDWYPRHGDISDWWIPKGTRRSINVVSIVRLHKKNKMINDHPQPIWTSTEGAILIGNFEISKQHKYVEEICGDISDYSLPHYQTDITYNNRKHYSVVQYYTPFIATTRCLNTWERLSYGLQVLKTKYRLAQLYPFTQ